MRDVLLVALLAVGAVVVFASGALGSLMPGSSSTNYLGQRWSDVEDRVEENMEADNPNPMAGIRL